MGTILLLLFLAVQDKPVQAKPKGNVTVGTYASVVDTGKLIIWAKTDCPIFAEITDDGIMKVYTCAASYRKKDFWWRTNGIRKIVIIGPGDEACEFPVERKAQ